MAQTIEESLLQAIKKDDRKAFDALMDKAQCGAYRLGRFPVLSLLYLYKSRKILSAYEETFLKVTNSVTLSEPAEISKKFSTKAGKCLRLYMNEVVTPLEMLLVLDKTSHLKKVYPMTNLSSAVKERLKSIYYIKYSLSVKFEGNQIIIDRRPLTYSERKKLITVCICAVLVILIAIGTPITTSVVMPKRLDKYIDLSADREYVLKKDVYVPKNYTIKEVNCTIVGNGHKLIFKKGASIEQFNGKMSDLVIESFGNAIFNTVSEKATIENVTINVNADAKTAESTALVALTNYGLIDGVTVNVSGKINALTPADSSIEELTFGGIVLTNDYKVTSSTNAVYGSVKNCKVNYSNFSITGEASANASFGGVAGVNNAYLQDCAISGKIIADTFDIAGICSVNGGGLLSGNVNEADIVQTSSSTGWNPIVSGIVLSNYNVVENCENRGNITAISSCQPSDVEEGKEPAVSVAGIVYLCGIRSTVAHCVNSGAITATGIGNAYVGGICARSYSLISTCISSGDIDATAKEIYAGGVLGSSEVTDYGIYVYFGTVENSICKSKISAKAMGDSVSCVGGIAGCVREASYGNYFGGGVTGSFFIGEYSCEVSYFGNIVGVCGANIYENNLLASGSQEYHNFDGNYYVSNSSKAFGATVTEESSFAQVEDKGATSASIEFIKNSVAYKTILSKFEK